MVHKIDLAIAWYSPQQLLRCACIDSTLTRRNFEKTVQAAYRWLADNYEDGDTIYLFGESELLFLQVHRFSMVSGFSRGAFQVRALSAMIEKARDDFVLMTWY